MVNVTIRPITGVISKPNVLLIVIATYTHDLGGIVQTISKNTSRELWIIDDDPAEVYLMKRALKDPLCALPKDCVIKVSTDGSQATQMLKDAADRNCLPELVVLDLNMPGIDGFDVLAFCQNSAQFARLSIAVVTTASEPSILERARALGASSVHTKPHSTQEAISMFTNVVAQYL